MLISGSGCSCGCSFGCMNVTSDRSAHLAHLTLTHLGRPLPPPDCCQFHCHCHFYSHCYCHCHHMTIWGGPCHLLIVVSVVSDIASGIVILTVTPPCHLLIVVSVSQLNPILHFWLPIFQI